MNITFYQGNKPCKETKKSCWGLGRGRGTGGSVCGCYMILEKGFRLISLTWLIMPAELTLALQETALSPQPGFSSPLSQVQGSRPSSPPHPPIPGYLRAAGNLRGHAPCRQNLKAPNLGRASSEHPFPAPSSRSSFSFLQVTRVQSV